MEFEKSLQSKPALPPSDGSVEMSPSVGMDSEEERIRAEEEEWARMRRQMEEEEERDRQESLGGAGVVIPDKVSSTPWSWSSASQQDDEEAMNLDRAMEERLVARRKASPSPSSVTSTSNSQAPNWRSRFGHRRVRAGSVAGSSISMHSVEEEEEEDEGGVATSRSRLTSTTSSSGVSRLRLSITSSASDEQESQEPDQPLSANTTSTNDLTSASVASPMTPAHIDTGVQIVVQEATPLAPRLLGAGAMTLDSPISPFPRRPMFGKRSFTTIDAPPSASPFKLSFDAPAALDQPPPSASHFRTSFDAPAPPRSSAPTKTSFGSSELSVPFPTKTSVGNDGGDLRVKLAAKRAAKKAKGSTFTLETVPHSPPVTTEMPAPPRPMVGLGFVGSLERRGSSSSLRLLERSPSPPTVGVDLVNAEPEIQLPPRKRTKSKVPAPLALKSKEASASSSTSSSAYVLSSTLSSSHRSTSSSSISSSSSASSNSSAKRLKNKLLGRVARNPDRVSTPHQTLFIFPPSPTKQAVPSATPSAMMLTTSYAAGNEGSSSSIPMLTPTPTLATFMQNQRRGISRKASSSSSASASSSGGGWLGGTPSTPTTACARVDARGYLGR